MNELEGRAVRTSWVRIRMCMSMCLWVGGWLGGIHHEYPRMAGRQKRGNERLYDFSSIAFAGAGASGGGDAAAAAAAIAIFSSCAVSRRRWLAGCPAHLEVCQSGTDQYRDFLALAHRPGRQAGKRRCRSGLYVLVRTQRFVVPGRNEAVATQLSAAGPSDCGVECCWCWMAYSGAKAVYLTGSCGSG